MLALDSNGNLFSWGRSEFGALSLKKETSASEPVRLNHHFSNVCKILCAADSSAVLTKDGDVYVCGRIILPYIQYIMLNMYIYYIGRNSSNRFGFGRSVECVDFFKKVSCIKKRIFDFSVAENHSAFVVEGGYLMTIGDNQEGQLGVGHSRKVKNFPSFIKKLSSKYIKVRNIQVHKFLKFDLINFF